MKHTLEKTICSAILKGYFHQVRLLVALGYNVNIANEKGQTPLMLCAMVNVDNWASGLARTLLETHMVAVGKTDFRGLTALHYACIYDREKMVKVLLDYSGFNTQAMDLLRNRPMHYAAVTGNSRIVEMLLGYEMKFDIKPSIWMTANIVGKTPIALAKHLQRSDCFVVLRDLVGEIRFPGKVDLKEARKINDWKYAKDTKRSNIFKPKSNVESLMDMPTYTIRSKVKTASKRYAKSSGEHERSHLENQSDSMFGLSKFAIHYSFDFTSLDYIEVPRYEEGVIYVCPALQDIESNEKETSDDNSKKDQKASINNAQNKDKIDLKLGATNTPNVENKNQSNIKNIKTTSKVTENVKAVEKKDGNEKENESQRSSSTEHTPDYSKVCKRYEIQRNICANEEDDEEETKDDEKISDSSEKDKSSEEIVKSIEKKDEDEEEVEEICEDIQFLDEKGGFYTTETRYRQPNIPKPFVQPFRSECLQDRNKLRCLCKQPSGTITNIDERFGRKIVGKYLAAVLLDVILPGYEKGPPFSTKCQKLIAWVYENGLLSVELMNEKMIPGHNMSESKLCDIYEEEYKKVTFRKEIDFPLCRPCPKSMFTRHTMEKKKKITKFCCTSCQCAVHCYEDKEKECPDWSGNDILKQLQYHYGYQYSHSYVKSINRKMLS